MKREVEEVYVNWMINTVLHHWPMHTEEPHFVNVISAYNGWTPLETGEKMTVTFGDQEYVIKRTR